MATRTQKSNLTDENLKKLNKKDGAKMADLLAKAISQANQVPAKKPTKKK